MYIDLTEIINAISETINNEISIAINKAIDQSEMLLAMQSIMQISNVNQ